MHVALLKCDSVHERFLHIEGDFPEMYERLLAVDNPDVKITTFDVRAGILPDLNNEYDAFICTGSRASVYDNEDWITELKCYVQLLYSTGRRFVGICFGHQLIAESLGGRVAQSERGWGIGVQMSQIQEHKRWMNPDRDFFAVPVSYKDQVIELPPDSETLASNSWCRHFMITAGQHFLGIQGHPELSKYYVENLIQSREDILGESRVSDGINSLKSEIHSDVLSHWILNFLRCK